MLLKYLDLTWTVWLRARPHRYLADSTLIELHWKVDLGFLLVAPGPYVNGGDFVPSRTISHTMKIHVRLKLRSAVEPLHFQTSAVPTSTVGLTGFLSLLPPLLPPVIDQEVCSDLSCLKKTVSLCLLLVFIFQNTKINISHPILAISLFWSIATATPCIFMNGIPITRRP